MASAQARKADRNPDLPEPALLAVLRAYWLRKQSGRTMPSRHEIAPSEIKAQLPNVLLVDVIDGGREFRYRLVGSRLQGSFPAVPTGRLMSELLVPFGDYTVTKTLDTYREVVSSRAPLRIRGSGALFAQDPKYFDALLMPLSDDGERVNMIFGGFFFEWDRAKEYGEPDTDRWSLALQA